MDVSASNNGVTGHRTETASRISLVLITWCDPFSVKIQNGQGGSMTMSQAY